jgi:hypothetical protein
MQLLYETKLIKVSGAGRWSSDVPAWGDLPYSPIPSAPPSESQIDYGLMAILMGNAAFFGCLNGARTGGIYGCVAGGTYAGIGTMTAFIFADSYKMYTDNKK